VDRPLIIAGSVKAIKGKIGSFADAHAGVANRAVAQCGPVLPKCDAVDEAIVIEGWCQRRIARPQTCYQPRMCGSRPNHVAASTAAVAVEQVFVGVNEKAGPVVGVQRTQSQKAAEADGFRLLPIVCL